MSSPLVIDESNLSAHLRECNTWRFYPRSKHLDCLPHRSAVVTKSPVVLENHLNPKFTAKNTDAVKEGHARFTRRLNYGPFERVK